MRTSALFDAKNCRFFEIYDVSAQTREEGQLSQCRDFYGQGGEGVNFSRFCANVLYGRSLI